MAADRRTLLLGGGLTAIIALAGWMYFGGSGTTTATNTSPNAPARARPRPAAAQNPTPDSMVAVHLDALASERDQPGDARRNPFRFQPRLAPPPPTTAKPAEPARPVAPVPEAATGPAPTPTIPLKFIGTFVREDGTKWAVLADGRGTFHGREGATIEGRYQIVKIGVESIELAYADGRGRQTIRLTGQ